MLSYTALYNKLFSPGKLYVTRGVHIEICDNPAFALFVTKSLKRHLNGDWGEMSEEDKKFNDEAIQNGSRIFSAYKEGEIKIWIITEAKNEDEIRECTTVLFPSEY